MMAINRRYHAKPKLGIHMNFLILVRHRDVHQIKYIVLELHRQIRIRGQLR